MPRQKQIQVTEIISEILKSEPQKGSFDWLTNIPLEKNFGKYYDSIIKIYTALGGNKNVLDSLILESKTRKLAPDAFFSDPYNFIFEFDEIQHFTTYKQIALEHYPKKLAYGFNMGRYIKYCKQHSLGAIKKGPGGYRKPTKEFPFENGRAAQRAFFDAFRDIQPTLNGLRSTVRIAEIELPVNFTRLNLESLLKEKLSLIGIKIT